MEPKRRRELTLASIALAVLAIAMWTVRGGGAPMPAQAPAASPASQATPADAKPPFAGVNLDALRTERPEPEAGTRNPFRFKPAPAPPPPPPQPTAWTKVPPPETVSGGPPPPPPPPRITLKYIGDMADPKKPGGRIAILSDGRSVYHGREGDVVEGRYQILRIGVESVDLAYLDGRGRQTIRQTGQ
jgi:hypothetical protein